MKHAELGEFVEELLPFTSEFMSDIVTTVDEDTGARPRTKEYGYLLRKSVKS